MDSSLVSHDSCSNNIILDEGSTVASWKDRSPHFFRSTNLFTTSSHTEEFEYSGTGHGSVMLMSGDAVVLRCSIKLKKEFGKGYIKNINEGVEIIVNNKSQTIKWSTVNQTLGLHICFDIRFGNMVFDIGTAPVNSFIPLDEMGNVNGTKLKLYNENPGAYVAYEMPLKEKEIRQIDVLGNPKANWWTVGIFLSNSGLTSMPNTRNLFMVKKFDKKCQGAISIWLTSDGKIHCYFQDQCCTKEIDNPIHLSQEIFLWIELFRCKISVKSLPLYDGEVPGYVKLTRDEENVMAMTDLPKNIRARGSPPFESSITCKSARLDGSFRYAIQETANENTVPKVIDDSLSDGSINDPVAVSDLKDLIDNLSLTQNMIQSHPGPHFKKMYLGMEREFKARLQYLENNQNYSSYDLVNLKSKFADTFSSLHAHEHIF
ncbi:uncharacterized protein LOC126814450 [Patella vulgata]|uniref:uncharacterized protein LOC126814450 n=1 Tax=Patella vulgata TaxID=6465 RepID=UPI0021801B1E|nr:uncharacterized protein LOC126814450 [Patella vulgata]